ncbi:MAG: hypothetical protein MR591_02555 [Helicobacter sp.]|nr:hypothetical protein [Helicobacter sp.]
MVFSGLVIFSFYVVVLGWLMHYGIKSHRLTNNTEIDKKIFGSILPMIK